MSILKTYDYPQDHNIVAASGGTLAVNLKPGDWVRHKYAEKPGFGVLVANGDNFITVLWSIAPQMTAQDQLAASMAQNIADEEDSQIMKDLTEAMRNGGA